ncbi:MAG: MFS transporter [Microbacteriaceae bacterium]
MSIVVERYPRAFWFLVTVNIIGWAGRIVSPFLTLYLSSQLNFSAATIGIIFSFYGFGGILSVVTAGILSDRFGPKWVLISSLVSTGIVSLTFTIVSEVIVIGLLTFAFGFATQAMVPAYHSLISFNSPISRMRKSFSISTIAGNLGFAIGPIIAGILAGIDFKYIFYLEASLVTVATLITLTMIPNPEKQIHLGQGTGWGFFSSLNLVFKDKIFLKFTLATIFYIALYKQIQTTMPLVMEQQGLGSDLYGFILTFNGSVVVLTQLLADRWTKTMTPGTVVALGAFITAIGFGVQIFAHDALSYILACLVWTIGELFHFSISNSIAAALAPPGYRGRYLGVFSTFYGVANIFGPTAGAFIFGALGSTGLWTICLVLGMLLTLFRWNSRKEIQNRMIALGRG